MGGFRARNKVAIVGYAQSQVGRHAPMSLGALAMQTARAAADDAGLDIGMIDGFVTTPLFPTLGTHAAEDGISIVSAHWLSQSLGIAAGYIDSPQGQLTSAIASAVNAIAAGAADYVIVHRALHNPSGHYHGNSTMEARGREQWGMPQGHFGPITAIAMAYNEYVHRYGVAKDALAGIAVEARKNGARLPRSYWYGKPLTRDDYLAAPVISDPIRRLDCDIPVDGVAAFVLTSCERARDLRHLPVCVSAYADMLPMRRRVPSHWPYDEIMELGELGVSRLCKRGGVDRTEIDYVQVYDGFAPLAFMWMELAGLCPQGEAHRMVGDGGIDSDTAGGKPVLASGGALGNGRMHGTPQLLDCYLQLARRAGERQRDVSLAMACQGVPHMGGSVLLSAC